MAPHVDLTRRQISRKCGLSALEKQRCSSRSHPEQTKLFTSSTPAPQRDSVSITTDGCPISRLLLARCGGKTQLLRPLSQVQEFPEGSSSINPHSSANRTLVENGKMQLESCPSLVDDSHSCPRHLSLKQSRPGPRGLKEAATASFPLYWETKTGKMLLEIPRLRQGLSSTWISSRTA